MLDLPEIFASTRTIAVVGMSDNPARASYEVARYLSEFYVVIPVNPNHRSIMGLTCYPDLASIPVQVDMIDLFQRSENVMAYVQPAIDIKVSVFWMQLGIENALAAEQLTAAGITVVQDRCTKIDHSKIRSQR
jgi:predicted CoA-binding protein